MNEERERIQFTPVIVSENKNVPPVEPIEIPKSVFRSIQERRLNAMILYQNSGAYNSSDYSPTFLRTGGKLRTRGNVVLSAPNNGMNWGGSLGPFPCEGGEFADQSDDEKASSGVISKHRYNHTRKKSLSRKLRRKVIAKNHR